MNSSKAVIRVIKKGCLPGDYDSILYVENVYSDINGRLSIGLTRDIWKAMKMSNYYVSCTDVHEDNVIKNFINLVKSILIPKREYVIELVEIKLEY